MAITITKRKYGKDKEWYYLEWGKGAGQRVASGIFTYKNPKSALEKNHNKESLATLESKRAMMILEKQSVATGYVPIHKIKSNFLDFYAEFVKSNARYGSRHLACSYKHFKPFLKATYISPNNIT